LSIAEILRLALGDCSTGVPRPKENAPPQDPTAGLCLRPYDGPRGWTFSSERGTPVAAASLGEAVVFLALTIDRVFPPFAGSGP